MVASAEDRADGGQMVARSHATVADAESGGEHPAMRHLLEAVLRSESGHHVGGEGEADGGGNAKTEQHSEEGEEEKGEEGPHSEGPVLKRPVRRCAYQISCCVVSFRLCSADGQLATGWTCQLPGVDTPLG